MCPTLVTSSRSAPAGRHSLALLEDGTVRAWGYNRNRQVGDGTTTNRDRPFVVPGVRDAVAIAAGGLFSLALLSNGTVMTWGEPTFDKQWPVPALVPGAGGIRAIAAGLVHAAALTETGTVLTWGDNSHSQLGRGRAAASGPVGLIKELRGVQSIASRIETTVAVLASGRIMTWGSVRGPEGRGTTLSPTPIPMSVDGLQYA